MKIYLKHFKQQEHLHGYFGILPYVILTYKDSMKHLYIGWLSVAAIFVLKAGNVNEA